MRIQLDFSEPISQIIEKLQPYKEEWITDITKFIIQWNNEDHWVTVQTSGTTGAAKQMQVKKDWMTYSAKNTLSYFGLEKGHSALLALSPHFIAGKMMLVRAMIGQLKLWICPPSDLSILNEDIQVDFCPLVPLQAEKHLDELKKIKHLLLGGAPVSPTLEVKLQALECQVYQSFAMTETLSHFAIRDISKKELAYTIFTTIEYGVDDSGCLWIKAPQLGQEVIQTTDVVDLVKGGFIWKQRADFMINSGGIKYNPEVLEKNCKFLQEKGWQFIISSVPDAKLGNKMVLVVEKDSLKGSFKAIAKVDFDLEPYAIPKAVYIVKTIPKTPFSQKVTRLKLDVIFDKENILAVHEIL